MASIEKKEIIQNGIFGIIAGMIMGGPAGAIAAGVTAGGLAHLEEKHDQELRRKEWERRHPDIVQRELEWEKHLEEIKLKENYYQDIISMMGDENIGTVFKVHPAYIDINADFLKCKSLNRGYSIVLDPDNNKYVKIKIYDNSDWVFHSNIRPYINGTGIILNQSDFKKELEKVKDNPNLDKFIIGREDKKIRSGFGAVEFWHYINYLFTIDAGKTFYVLW